MKKGWEMKTLGDIGTIFNGNSINENVKKEKYLNVEEGLPFIATKDVGYDTIVDYDNGIRIPFEEKNNFKIAPSNTIFICAEGGSAGRKICFIDRQVCFGNKLFALVTKNDISSRFVYYWYFSDNFQKDFKTSLAGIIGGVSLNKFREIQVPIPRFSEQQQIVSILDEVFAAIDQAKENLQRNLQNARELFKGKLNSIFTTKGTDWVERRIENVSKVVNGFSFKSNDFSPKNKIKSVKITNVGVKEFVEETDNYLPESFSKTYSEYSVQEGNIVIALTRTIISNGLKVAVVPESYEGALINQRVAALVPDTKIVNQRFLYNFLCTDSVMKYVKANVNTLMQPNLSINDLKKMPINLPSLQSQKKIILQLDKLSTETKALENIYQQKLDHLEDLKKSILKKAFSGELSSPEGAFSAKDGHRPSNQKTPSLTSPERA